MTARLFLLIVLVASTASCGAVKSGLGRVGIGSGKNRFYEADGVRYRGRVVTDRTDRRSMTITVHPAAANPGAALEAGRYEATKYCLRTYGGSATKWTIGPDQPPDTAQVVDDTITLQGRCIQR